MKENAVLIEALREMGDEVLTRSPLIHEGKAKRVRECPTERGGGLVLMEFKDSFTAFDAIKKDEKAGKGRLNCAISTQLMRWVREESDGTIPTAFIAQIGPIHQLMYRVRIIPIEVIVRNEAQGSFCKRYGDQLKGLAFDRPLVELGLKNDELHDPFFTNDVIPVEIMQLLSWGELRRIRDLAASINTALIGIFLSHGIRLLDFKLEFGRGSAGEILLADEITGDTCRLVDAKTGEKLDKDNFRFDLGDVMKGYIGLAARLGLDPEAILQGCWR